MKSIIVIITAAMTAACGTDTVHPDGVVQTGEAERPLQITAPEFGEEPTFMAAVEAEEIKGRVQADFGVQVLTDLLVELGCRVDDARVVTGSVTAYIATARCGDGAIAELTATVAEDGNVAPELQVIGPGEGGSETVRFGVTVDGDLVVQSSEGESGTVSSPLTWAEAKCTACKGIVAGMLSWGVKSACGWGGALVCASSGVATMGIGTAICGTVVTGVCWLGGTAVGSLGALGTCRKLKFCP